MLQVKQLAKPPELSDDIVKTRFWKTVNLANALNVVLNGRRRKNIKSYVVVERPDAYMPYCAILKLDKNGKPIPVDQSKTDSHRKIAIFVADKIHYLRNEDGLEDAELRAHLQFSTAFIKKVGFEVIFVGYRDSDQFEEGNDYLEWFSKKLASQITGMKVK